MGDGHRSFLCISVDHRYYNRNCISNCQIGIRIVFPDDIVFTWGYRWILDNSSRVHWGLEPHSIYSAHMAETWYAYDFPDQCSISLFYKPYWRCLLNSITWYTHDDWFSMHCDLQPPLNYLSFWSIWKFYSKIKWSLFYFQHRRLQSTEWERFRYLFSQYLWNIK